MPEESLYQQLGGEAAIESLVEAFYDIIEQDEAARELHLLHLRGHGVAHSRLEQFNYLSGFFGGPQYYVMAHGHARLKEIHEHVPIDSKMRDLWLSCMEQAIAKVAIRPELRDRLMRHFTRAAEAARNLD